MHFDLNIWSEAALIYLLLWLSPTSLCQSVSVGDRTHRLIGQMQIDKGLSQPKWV